MAEKELISSLSKNNNVLAVCENLNPAENIFDFYKSAIRKYKNVCIITANKPSSELMERLENKGVNYSSCFFIDCVSSKIMKAPSNNQVYYLSSPNALTELSLKFSSIVDKYNLIIFDNLDSLLLYNSEVFVLRFLNSIMSNVQKKKSKALYWTMFKGKEKFVSDVSLFADKVVEVK